MKYVEYSIVKLIEITAVLTFIGAPIALIVILVWF